MKKRSVQIAVVMIIIVLYAGVIFADEFVVTDPDFSSGQLITDELMEDSFGLYNSLSKITGGAMYADTNGNIGLGTTSPNKKLTIHLGATNDDGFFIYSDSGNLISQINTFEVTGNRSGQFSLYTEGTRKIFLNAYNGNIEYAGSLTHTSDRRLKENIVPISNALSKINGLMGYTFNMIDNSNRRQAGVMAQDVQRVLPEAVSEMGEDGYLGVDYTQLVPLLIEAVKEQQQIIETLQDRIVVLEGR